MQIGNQTQGIIITCVDEWWTQLYNTHLLYNLCRWGLNTLQCYATCAVRGEIQYKFICYATCGDEVEVVQWEVEQATIIFICYAICADEIKLVQIRGGTQYTNLLLCNLCQECITSLLLWWNNDNVIMHSCSELKGGTQYNIHLLHNYCRQSWFMHWNSGCSIKLEECMTLWGKPEWIHVQNMEQLYAHDCHLGVSETSGHRGWHTKSTNTCTTQEQWVSETVHQVRHAQSHGCALQDHG